MLCSLIKPIRAIHDLIWQHVQPKHQSLTSSIHVPRSLHLGLSKIPPLQPVQLSWCFIDVSSARTAHDTVLLGAADVFSGASAWSAAALVVVSATNDELA